MTYTRRVKRAPHSLLAALAVLSSAGCSSRITRAECMDMLDRYVDMTAAAEPDSSELPPAASRAARETKKALLKGEARYKRVQEQCEAEITKREYRCAIKAPTPETWQACID
ncbi:MAG: hypothetical protein JWP97_1824 [Labilithrix sp.]|nr:hypothetical protein [Labilithrix sp.]